VFFDPLYIILIVVTLLISGGAQLYIRSTYGRWSRIANAAGLTGG
jgi:Zn-dependent membrane protease YugP